MEKIEIDVAKDGTMSYAVSGVKGGSCRKLTAAIDAIAGAVLESKVTGEFCEMPQAQQQKQSNG